jgi:predicted transcriptional regulator of viral defense system
VKKGELQRVAHGLYNLPHSNDFAVSDDEMYRLGLRFKQAVFSHDTALYLHNLNDRDPLNYSVTLPTGYNTKTLVGEGFKVFSLKKELHEQDVVEVQTMYSNFVRTYSLERTICDYLRSRNRLPKEVVTAALKRYVKRPDRDLNALAQLAEKFNISKILETYLEVLL